MRPAVVAAAAAVVCLVPAALLYGAGCGTTPAPPPPPDPVTAEPVVDDRPDILFVLWDTTRADHLSLYGHPAPTTPRLDAFAREAAVYERATSRAMWTLPSHSAMFTGLAASTHQAEYHRFWLDGRHQTLAERLGASGYQTFAFSANPVVSSDTNLLQGFDVRESAYPSGKGAKRGRYSKAAKINSRRKLIPEDASTELSPAFKGNTDDKWGRSSYKDAAPVAHRAFEDFLAARDPNRPYFAYLNLMEAHSPRTPSLRSRHAVADAETVQASMTIDQSLFALNEYIVGKRDFTPAELKAIRAVYDASVRDLDEATGDLFDSLRAAGRLDHTVVIVVADHGEMLGEHRSFEHRYAVWDPLLHVPLLIRYPDRFPAGRVKERVSTADLFATVLDVAGLPVPDGVESRSLAGRTTFEPVVFAQMLDPFTSQLANIHEAYPQLSLEPWARTYCVAYEGAWQLIYGSDGDHHLFDLDSDPGQELDRLAADPERRERLIRALDAFERRLPPYEPSLADPPTPAHERMFGRIDKSKAAPEGDDDDGQLALLGYTEGDVGMPLHHEEYCGPYAKEAPRREPAAP